MSVHEGHRERLKRRFLQEGLDNFDEIQVLELLLFYAIPRRDTNPLAHRLLDQFGSLAGVLESPASTLGQVPGIGENAATLLQLITAVSRYYMICRASVGQPLNTVERCGAYLTPRFFGLRDEAVCALCLDAKCKPLACRILGQGSVNAAGVPIRKIVEFALSANATSVVLAHNHPSGIALPSQADIAATERLSVALDAVGIILADHIIVSDEDFVSMAASGVFRPVESAAAPQLF